MIFTILAILALFVLLFYGIGYLADTLDKWD